MKKKYKFTGLYRLIYLTYLVCLLSCLFLSCASKPRFEGKGDLCGLVIDENNRPVKDLVVYCQAADEKKLFTRPKPVLTNESGLFVFYGLPSGEYILSGEKNNYLKIKPLLYSFDDRSKIICLQTKSFKAALLNAEELIRLGQAEEAEEVLRGISCETDSVEKLYVQAFLFFTEADLAARRKLISEIKNNSSDKGNFFTEYAEKLEEVNR